MFVCDLLIAYVADRGSRNDGHPAAELMGRTAALVSIRLTQDVEGMLLASHTLQGVESDTGDHQPIFAATTVAIADRGGSKVTA